MQYLWKCPLFLHQSWLWNSQFVDFLICLKKSHIESSHHLHKFNTLAFCDSQCKPFLSLVTLEHARCWLWILSFVTSQNFNILFNRSIFLANFKVIHEAWDIILQDNILKSIPWITKLFIGMSSLLLHPEYAFFKLIFKITCIHINHHEPNH